MSGPEFEMFGVDAITLKPPAADMGAIFNEAGRSRNRRVSPGLYGSEDSINYIESCVGVRRLNDEIPPPNICYLR